MRKLSYLLIGVFILFVFGCDPIVVPVDTTLGGKVGDSEQVLLDIPMESLKGENPESIININIKKTLELIASEKMGSPVFDISADSEVEIVKPLTLNLVLTRDLGDSDIAYITGYNESTDKWERVPGSKVAYDTKKGDTLTVEITEFKKYRIRIETDGAIKEHKRKIGKVFFSSSKVDDDFTFYNSLESVFPIINVSYRPYIIYCGDGNPNDEKSKAYFIKWTSFDSFEMNVFNLKNKTLLETRKFNFDDFFYWHIFMVGIRQTDEIVFRINYNNDFIYFSSYFMCGLEDMRQEFGIKFVDFHPFHCNKIDKYSKWDGFKTDYLKSNIDTCSGCKEHPYEDPQCETFCTKYNASKEFLKLFNLKYDFDTYLAIDDMYKEFNYDYSSGFSFTWGEPDEIIGSPF